MSETRYPEHKKREIFISDRISQGSVKDVIKDIFEINADDDQKEKIYKDWERTPIKLFINSYGGSVYDILCVPESNTAVHPSEVFSQTLSHSILIAKVN